VNPGKNAEAMREFLEALRQRRFKRTGGSCEQERREMKTVIVCAIPADAISTP
jgi:hypothetical protein